MNPLRVRLDPRTRVLEDGRLLIGGVPLIVQRLRRPLTETTSDTALGQRWLATGLGQLVLDNVPPASADQLTVVVPAHGRAARVATCVAALAGLEVVVVDDASDPPLDGATLRLPSNGGPGAARNAGMARVSTPYVAFVDSDVTVPADALLALTRHLQIPEVAVVAPRLRGTGGPRWWQRYDAAFSSLDLGPHPAPVRPGSSVSYLPSACLVARTATIRDIGAFDPTLRLGEDVDLIWRLAAAGHQIRYDPTVVAQHDTRPSFSAWLRQVFDYGTSAAPLATRHGAAAAPAALAPGLGLAGLALLLRRWWSLPIAALAWASTSRRLTSTVPVREAVRVAGSGLVSAVRQESSLVVRHWLPLTLIATTTRTGRRMLATAVIVDTTVALTDRRDLDPITRLGGRRITDLSYGAGLAWGSIRQRSFRALMPRRSR